MTPDSDRERLVAEIRRARAYLAGLEDALAVYDGKPPVHFRETASIGVEKRDADFTRDGGSGNPLAPERDTAEATGPAKNITENIPAAPVADEAEDICDVAVKPDSPLAELVRRAAGSVSDEAEAIVASAREVQRASKGVAELAEKAVKPKPRRPWGWTDEKKAELRRLWVDLAPLADIAAHFGVTESAITTQAKKMGLERRFKRSGKPIRPKPVAESADDRNQRKTRTCLKCRKPFQSLHAGNRICPRCKPLVDRASGIDIARTGEAI